MTDRNPENIVASIHQRLLNVSKQTGRVFNDLVMHYAIERFLYRLTQSRFADRVVLKGGLLLQVWNTPVTRITRDIDLLGKLNNDLGQIKEMVRAVCVVAVDDDGLIFDPESVTAVRIVEDADDEGVRASFRGRFGKMPLAMQIDFGFGDVMTPGPTPITYPSVLDHPPPRMLAYNRETAVAEKFEAMVKLGELNSRMKDFFDIWVLAQNFTFDGAVLAAAIRSTFGRRKTGIEAEPACFTDRFANAPGKAAQWKGFPRTSHAGPAPVEFPVVVACVGQFLQAVAMAAHNQVEFNRTWVPGGPWR